MIRLIVGLGNPGRKYSGTRHNIGRRVEETLREVSPAPKVRFANLDCFMNESGAPVAELSRRNGITPQEILVVSDDFELPLGTLRLRLKGSSGGHNGLKSILEVLGTDDVPRLRVGIGPVPAGEDPADFVLKSFGKGEHAAVDAAVERAAEAVQVILNEGWEPAMNRFNGKTA
jgi:PTH1 family peptidyl-tRNA hydrolase